jgi:hypothetical protein
MKTVHTFKIGDKVKVLGDYASIEGQVIQAIKDEYITTAAGTKIKTTYVTNNYMNIEPEYLEIDRR